MYNNEIAQPICKTCPSDTYALQQGSQVCIQAVHSNLVDLPDYECTLQISSDTPSRAYKPTHCPHIKHTQHEYETSASEPLIRKVETLETLTASALWCEAADGSKIYCVNTCVEGTRVSSPIVGNTICHNGEKINHDCTLNVKLTADCQCFNTPVSYTHLRAHET